MKGIVGGPVELTDNANDPIYREYSDSRDGPFHTGLRRGDRYMRVVHRGEPAGTGFPVEFIMEIGVIDEPEN